MGMQSPNIPTSPGFVHAMDSAGHQTVSQFFSSILRAALLAMINKGIRV
jgi:hypothetical protein